MAAAGVILYTAMTQNDDPHLLNEINAKTQFTNSAIVSAGLTTLTPLLSSSLCC